jgi:hypothetical protein
MQRGAEMSVTDFLDTGLKSHQNASAAQRLRRDLARDWQRWTAMERIVAAGLLTAMVAGPVVSIAAILHPMA